MDQPDSVSGAVEQRIVFDSRRFVAFAKASDIWRHHAKACRRERRDLMSPFKPCIGKAVEHQDEWPRAVFDIMDANAIYGHVLMRKG